ncbi:hypothetical protein N431DRAFT_501051 [Stipitochalara longipes BDJ]|nr:hypothetical protein N431DRAFT_501051 [Stipitochalara longipes BDJ]
MVSQHSLITLFLLLPVSEAMGGVSRINHGLVFIFLTLSLLALTCLQASGSIVTRNITLVNQSRGYPIFILRTFSELASVSLSATISATLERIKWAMICREGRSRARFVDFLALQDGTTVLGLLSLAVGAAVPSFTTRVWSIIRLIVMILVPGIGILIMSQVQIQMAFSPAPSETTYFGYDNQPMNASVAVEYTGFTDLLLSWKFGTFLADPGHSVDLTLQSERAQPCSLNANSHDSSGCNRTYFVAGESLIVMPELVANASFPDADIILASNHRGYLLNFNAGNSSTEFNSSQECRTYSGRYLGVRAGAIRLCVGNPSPNELEAPRLTEEGLLTCPGPIASQQMCLNDTSWYYNAGWTARMTIFFQDSAVAYSRSNGTILWHSFMDTPAIPLNISSLQILEAYDHLLFDTTTLLNNGSTPLPLFSGTSFPTFLWIAEPEFSDQSAIDLAAIDLGPSTAAYSTLQSLLAFPMYFCQNGIARRLLPGAMDSKSVSNPGLSLLFSQFSEPPERSSPASLAYHRYEVTVSFETLIAYIILSGTALLACSVVHIVMSLSSRVGRGSQRPRLSRFPTLDLFMHCTIEDENRYVIYQGRSGFFPVDTSQRSLREWLSNISIKWSRPRNIEDGLDLFGEDFVNEHGEWSSTSMRPISPHPSQSKVSLFRGD